jgi:hypothetical protein
VILMPNSAPTYDRAAAVTYAHTWASARNPRYYNFDKLGGDCTNFISQCIFAGCGVMNRGRNGWYYNNVNDRSASWSGVEFLHNFLTRASASPGPRGEVIGLGDAAPGDIVQLSFDGAAFSHSLLVVETGSGGVFVATHTYDSDYRPLGSYTFLGARVLGIR